MKYTYLLLCFALIFASACNDEGGPVAQAPVAVSPFDWNSPEYDWAVTFIEDCEARGFDSRGFYPRSAVRVFGATESYLLLSLVPMPTGGGLYRYDLATGAVRRIWPYGFDWAEISPDGSLIAVRTGLRGVAFVHPETGEFHYFVASLDSIAAFAGWGEDLRWLPDSRSVAVHYRMQDGRKHTFLLSAYPPHTLTPYSERPVVHTHFTDTRELFFNHEIMGVKIFLEVRHIGDTALVAKIRMPKGIYRTGVSNGGNVSPDGKWLVMPVTANLAMTRLSHRQIMDGIGIFDLREGSPTQYQLYRFIGDHTHFNRHCLYSHQVNYTVSAVWSHDSKYLYHERLRMSDSTLQVVRYDPATGQTEELTNFFR